jgi:hypothetical protein
VVGLKRFSDLDAAADIQVKYEEAARAAENIPLVKFGRALARARARRAAQTPAEKSISIELADMPALKEPEHITLAEGLTDAAAVERSKPARVHECTYGAGLSDRPNGGRLRLVPPFIWGMSD